MAVMIISIMITFLLLGFPMMVPLLVASLAAFLLSIDVASHHDPADYRWHQSSSIDRRPDVYFCG